MNEHTNDPALIMARYSANDRKSVAYFNVITRDCKDGKDGISAHSISAHSISYLYIRWTVEPLELTLWED